MMGHTPGPWEVDDWEIVYISGHKHYYLGIHNNLMDGEWSGTGVAVCLLPEESDSKKDREAVKANSALISAAPELLEACKAALNQIQYLHEKFQTTGSGSQVLARLYSAIAKAEGK